MSIRRRAMNRRRLFQALSLLFGLLLAASILTPQGGAQEGIKFEMPKDDVKKKVVKPAAPSPATVEMLNGQSARIDSLTDGDAVKLKVTLDKPVELAYVASFKFADDGRQIDKCIITPGAQSCETKVAPALGWYWGKDGKGQAEGAMLMGDPSQPLKQTKTIAQNAEELARYVAGVKRATGARTVDLVAHGMGGLVSRYYIDRLMGDRDVAQLIMLGSPHGGTPCANLPASLGFYLPATLELRS